MHIKKVLLLVIPLAVCCVLTVLILSSHQFSTLAQAIVPKTEDFTELYFENHLELPKVASPGAAVKFDFTIHNLEKKTINYPVSIHIEDDQKPPQVTSISDSIVKVSDNQSVRISTQAIIPELILTPRAKIIITLKNMNQKIFFWVNIPAVFSRQGFQQDPESTPIASPVTIFPQ